MTQYAIIPELQRKFIDTARARAPQECCGFAYGFSDEGVVKFYTAREVFNMAKNPAGEFLISQHEFREAVLYADRAKLALALWHSHPSTPAIASKSDVQMLLLLQEIPFIIVGVQPSVIKIFEVTDNGTNYREAFSLLVPPEELYVAYSQ